MSKSGTQNRDIQPTGGRQDSARQAAARARSYYGRENVTIATFSGLYGRGRARTLGQGLPPDPPFPLVPINTPWVFAERRYTESSIVSPICSLG